MKMILRGFYNIEGLLTENHESENILLRVFFLPSVFVSTKTFRLIAPLGLKNVIHTFNTPTECLTRPLPSRLNYKWLNFLRCLNELRLRERHCCYIPIELLFVAWQALHMLRCLVTGRLVYEVRFCRSPKQLRTGGRTSISGQWAELLQHMANLYASTSPGNAVANEDGHIELEKQCKQEYKQLALTLFSEHYICPVLYLEKLFLSHWEGTVPSPVSPLHHSPVSNCSFELAIYLIHAFRLWLLSGYLSGDTRISWTCLQSEIFAIVYDETAF